MCIQLIKTWPLTIAPCLNLQVSLVKLSETFLIKREHHQVVYPWSMLPGIFCLHFIRGMILCIKRISWQESLMLSTQHMFNYHFHMQMINVNAFLQKQMLLALTKWHQSMCLHGGSYHIKSQKIWTWRTQR